MATLSFEEGSLSKVAWGTVSEDACVKMTAAARVFRAIDRGSLPEHAKVSPSNA